MNKIQQNVLEDLSLSIDDYLYRYTDDQFLKPNPQGSTSIAVNPGATEMIQDVFGNGHLIMAKEIGPGLAFTAQPEPEFGGENRMLVRVQISALLDQGCTLYPDKSTYTLNSLFIHTNDDVIEVEAIE